MTLKRIYAIGSRDSVEIVNRHECFECGKSAMKEDSREFMGEIYCRNCAERVENILKEFKE